MPPALREGITPASGQASCRGARLLRHCWMTHIASKRWVYRSLRPAGCRPTRCCLPGALMGGAAAPGPQDGEGPLSGLQPGAWPPRWIAPTAWVALRIRSAGDRGGAQRRPATSVASAASRWLSPTTSISLHRKPPHRLLADGRWPSGDFRGLHGPGHAGHRRNGLPLQRNAPGRWRPQRASPRRWWHGGVWLRTSPGVRAPCLEAGRRTRSGCWACAWKPPGQPASKPPRIDSGWRQQLLERKSWTGTGPRPRTDWPWSARRAGPCCAKRSARACWPSATTSADGGLAVAAADAASPSGLGGRAGLGAGELSDLDQGSCFAKAVCPGCW